MDEETKVCGWRLPVDVMAAMKELAQRNGRSVEVEAAHALRRHLAQPPTVVVNTPPLAAAAIDRPARRTRKKKGADE